MRSMLLKGASMASTELRVKELLKERGWTTKVLSEKTGMSESYLTHIKNGTRRWNEDALRKIADAFGLDPIFLFSAKREPKEDSRRLGSIKNEPPVDIQVRKVPVMGDIPSYPSVYNNEVMQVTTGYKEVFVPVLNEFSEGVFCLMVENNSMSPRFVRGDQLIIVPGAQIESGEIAAVEYKTDKMIKGIMVVSFVDEFVLLESVSHKQPPIALVRGKDDFRVIGKILYRYQRYS